MTGKPENRNALRAPALLFCVAFGLRLLLLTVCQLYVLSPVLDHHAFGSEAGHIARALLNGRGYSDPFWWGPSGATAWTAPGYPLLLAAIFKLFGVYSAASAWVTVAVQCLMDSLTAVWIWKIGMRCFNRSVALWTAWIWALSPFVMALPLKLLWETSISTAWFTLAFLLTLRLRGVGESQPDHSLRGWAQWGLVWGLVALFNPSILLFLPCCGAWVLLGPGIAPRRKLAGAVAAALVFSAMLGPWLLRNERVFHRFIPARGNLGIELCDGNCYGIAGVIGQWDHPDLSLRAMERYRTLGEAEYNRERMLQFKQMLRQRPLQFVEMTLLRVDFYWFGVPRTMEHPFSDVLGILSFCCTSVGGLLGAWWMWRRKAPAAGLFVMALLSMPALYYVVATQERFRHPLEPLLYLLGSTLFCEAEMRWSVRWLRLAAAQPAPAPLPAPCPELAEAG